VITVVIPTIPPRAEQVGRAIESVWAQTLQPKAVEIVLDSERRGPAATRNRALERVDTEWVAFLDDDDELYPNHLRLLARCARLTDSDVVYPGYDSDDDQVNCFGLPFDATLLERRNFIPVTVLARTEMVLAAGGFKPHPDESGDPCEDWGLWLSMLDIGAKFTHLPVRTWRWNTGGTRGHTDRW
jgi:glycosyltransferase involved in cell wall biosynthesis